MLFYLASLQSISGEVYEAAAIDGASAWQTFRQHHVPAAPAGPLLRRHGRGHRRAPAVRPGGHRRRPERRPEQRADDDRAVPLQRRRSRSSNFGYAAAVGIILFVVIFGATLVQRRLFGAGAVVVSRDDRAGRAAPGRRRVAGRLGVGAGRRPAAAGARRRSPTSFLIGYALLMFVPFAWSLDHVVQDAARLGPADVHPGPVHARGAGSTAFTELDPPLPRLFFNSALHRRRRDGHQRRPREHGRVRLRPAAVPRPRAPVPARPGDADDPRPAPPRAGLPDPATRSA